MSANLVFPHTFVYDPGVTALEVGAAKGVLDLTVGQVGIFNAKTGLGLNGAAWTSVPEIFIAQNLGDKKFGAVRTKNIHINNVVKLFGRIATNPSTQLTYYGWNGTAGNIDLRVGQELSVVITIYERKLSRFYNPRGYTVTIPVFLGGCAVCESDCTKLDPCSVADAIVAAINGTDAPAGNFPTTRELQNYITAATVSNGLTGDTKKCGVRLVGKAISPDVLNSCNPAQFFDVAFSHFSVGTRGDCNKPLVTTLRTAKPGSGYPLEVATAEKESQGYDRVREVFDDPAYMALDNFIINAKSDKTYDAYALDYNWGHSSKPSAASPARIVEPYRVNVFVPRATGTAFEAAINAWIAGSTIAAVDIDTTTTTTTTTTL